jgi:CelD/BcsL family acetyltransferase involved in cellulose biosynthesis
MSGTARIDLIADPAMIEDEWRELWDRSERASPFQAPDWLVPWITHFAADTLRIFTLRRRGRLIGLLPLFEHSGKTGRRLLPCGAGLSDYLDGVWDDGTDPQELAPLLARAARTGTLDLFNLCADAPLLSAPLPDGIRDLPGESGMCPVLPLDSRDPFAACPAPMIRNLAYGRRRAAKSGKIRVDQVAGETLPATIGIFFHLHDARWRQRGQPGVLSDEAVRRFHRDAAPRLLRAGLLRLYVLKLDDRPIAALYGLLAKRRFHYYLGGFDPAFAPLGPGTILIGHAIEMAAQEGAAEFDFLSGREAYKYRWGAVDRRLRSRMIGLAPAPALAAVR